MSLVLQNPLSYRMKLYSFSNTKTHFNPTKPFNFSQFYHHPLQFHTYPFPKTSPFLQNHIFSIKAYDSSINSFKQQEQQKPSNKLLNFDSFLYFLESICVISSFLISLGCFVNWVFIKQQNNGVLVLGNRVLVWLLACAVGLGSIIRRRQWRRVCGPSSGPRPGSENGNVVERIEKLEESLKSVTSIVRMLFRQLEKLGIRFRVTRKSLKDPIAETAALAQKNSEATRALVVQEGILEKELAEVQKVLLAMQDQQQKQLELILAIAKSGKLFDSKQPPSQELGPNKSVSDNGSGQVDGHQINSISHREATTNDIASGS